MKSIIAISIIVFISNLIFAQKNMVIYKSDHTSETLILSDVDSIKFYSFPCGSGTVSYAGQTYHTVLIGAQCWLKENLNVGTMISGSSVADSMRNNGILEKYCYANDPANCATYGGLYQWGEAMQYSTTPGAQGICPAGWHIPKRAEFETLMSVSGGYNALLAIGQTTGDTTGTNTSGFSALLAGIYLYDRFKNNGTEAEFWSSDNEGENISVYMVLLDETKLMETTSDLTLRGLSIRCLRD